MATKLWCTRELTQIISQPKHPDLNVDGTCLQRYLYPICFCGGRILLVLEVRVEEEASLAQLWEHIKSQYLQINPRIKSLVPSVYDCVTGPKVCIPAGQKAPVCNHKGPLQREECIAFLDLAGWSWLCFGLDGTTLSSAWPDFQAQVV